MKPNPARFRVSDIGDDEVDIEGQFEGAWCVICTWKKSDWLDWTGIEVPEAGEVEFELTPVKPARPRRRK